MALTSKFKRFRCLLTNATSDCKSNQSLIQSWFGKEQNLSISIQRQYPLHDLKFVRSMVKEGVEGISLSSETKVVICGSQLFHDGPDLSIIKVFLYVFDDDSLISQLIVDPVNQDGVVGLGDLGLGDAILLSLTKRPTSTAQYPNLTAGSREFLSPSVGYGRVQDSTAFNWDHFDISAFHSSNSKKMSQPPRDAYLHPRCVLRNDGLHGRTSSDRLDDSSSVVRSSSSTFSPSKRLPSTPPYRKLQLSLPDHGYSSPRKLDSDRFEFSFHHGHLALFDDGSPTGMESRTEPHSAFHFSLAFHSLVQKCYRPIMTQVLIMVISVSTSRTRQIMLPEAGESQLVQAVPCAEYIQRYDRDR
ncbi:unnamed protein product [Darwinula stevensoni]|uniref:Uncharacterized protein n=1 Tax=Darwinula stevensoni TaxID=69355 RepID=A0A7R8X3L7_9CRUS|nr:unnamed protein product [Darwinula stevensoni]CAG0885137.1 unnamed protein product [Darwinula stevensoni]